VSRCYGTPALLGSRATEDELRRQIGKGVDVLHLASHALFDPVYPLQSALFLTDGQHAAPLTAERLFEQPLSARMVVLSACETGMGQVIDGDDLLGLVRSFYLGGAFAVLSSLWPVEDEATRLFMAVFHEKARNGDFGVAWIAAREAVRSQGFPPSSYGAFVLAGSLGSGSQ
jgi:CHAT domain-containing protein